MDFVASADHKVKLKEIEKKDNYLDLARNRKAVEHKSDGDTRCNEWYWYSHQRINTVTGVFGNKRTSGDHQNYCIIEISKNTEENPVYLRRLAITQTPVKNHRLTLVRKKE